MMRIAIIGRTKILLETAKKLSEAGFHITLVITSKEAPEYKVGAKDYEGFARAVGARFIKTGSLEKPEVFEALEQIETMDMAISLNFTGIISQKVINYFKLGILNAHGGDLPKYRGNACQAWAIVNGENRIGLCIHRMIGGELDSGDIVGRMYLPIDVNTRVGEVYEWVESVTPDIFLDSVTALANNPGYVIEKQSKDTEDALRCYPRRPEDGRIDWSNTNEEIVRLINASSEPYAGAFADYEGENLVIWRAQLYEDEENYLAIPGQVAQIQEEGVIVIAGSGKVLLTEVTYDGQRMNPSKLIRSIRKRLK